MCSFQILKPSSRAARFANRGNQQQGGAPGQNGMPAGN